MNPIFPKFPGNYITRITLSAILVAGFVIMGREGKGRGKDYIQNGEGTLLSLSSNGVEVFFELVCLKS